MSKAEILQELSKLQPAERGELLERLQELAESDLLAGIGISAEETAFLQREWREFESTREAGCSWSDVAARLRSSTRRA
jgi:hypothetical protein